MTPSVSIEQLSHLLQLGHESETLDYKRACDLSDVRTQVELAKDIAAMQVLGGYIVVGADDGGRPVPPGVPPDQWKMFDEASLRAKMARWIPEPFELRTAVHTIGDCTFAVIYVGQRTDGFCILKEDGKYHHVRRTEGQRDVFVFRRGDVMARHGSSSEKWRQDDVARIYEAAVAARKDEWRRELVDTLEAAGVGRAAQRLVSGPVANFTWRLDAETFDAATLELFRSNDDIPLRRALNDASSDARRLLDEADWDELATVVGRVTSIAALAIAYRRPEWRTAALDVLAAVYRYAFDAAGYVRADTDGPRLWLLVAEHLLALGALAVRADDWAAVRDIVLRKPGEADPYYASWLRHALTEAARSNKLATEDRRSTKSLITLAVDRASELPSLHPDVGPESDDLITSVCQFDMVAALTTIAATGSTDSSGWYSNFARFYSSRTEPVVLRLLDDFAMRSALFDRPDAELAAALREVDRMAQSEGFRFNGWHGFSSPRIEKFIAEHQANA